MNSARFGQRSCCRFALALVKTATLPLLALCLLVSCGARSIPAGSDASDPGVAAGVGARGHDQQTHAAVVGIWTSSYSTLRLLDDHTGAYDGRSCTWREIATNEVMTRCEAALRDDWVRAFAVGTMNEESIGRLEFSEEIFRRER